MSKNMSDKTTELDDKDFIRYSRQILLPEVSEQGQHLLGSAHLVVVGVGGLGQLAAQYLAAAGVGQLTLIDHDAVELSNLPRQLLFSEADIGHNKAQIAQAKLTSSYPACHTQSLRGELTEKNADQWLTRGQLVLDCTDNFNTRHTINRACIKHSIPLVSGSVAHFQGQLLTVDQQKMPAGGCYHCLFPQQLKVSQSCSTVGVLGPTVGIIASMQALIAIHLLLDIQPPTGRFLRFDGKTLRWHEAKLRRDPSCPVCQSAQYQQ